MVLPSAVGGGEWGHKHLGSLFRMVHTRSQQPTRKRRGLSAIMFSSLPIAGNGVFFTHHLPKSLAGNNTCNQGRNSKTAKAAKPAKPRTRNPRRQQRTQGYDSSKASLISQVGGRDPLYTSQETQDRQPARRPPTSSLSLPLQAKHMLNTKSIRASLIEL